MNLFIRRSSWLSLLIPIVALAVVREAEARPWRPAQIPNGTAFGCLNCHSTAFGGGRNAFGLEVEKVVGVGSQSPFWSAALAALDSDGDGYTNGEELGDPDGNGVATPGAKITNPGDASSNPVGNKMPTTSLTGPKSGSVFTSVDAIVISATAADTDGSISQVEFFDGTNSLGVVTASPFQVSVSLKRGLHSLTAKATDDRKGTAQTTAVSVTVNDPPLVLTSILPSGANQVTLQWTNGAGPFVVQSKKSITSLTWNNGPAISAHEATVDASANAEFFRVLDLGQISSIPLSVYLSGALEQPAAITTDGKGFGLLRLEGDQLIYDVRALGLSGPVTGAHIHGPAAASAPAPVLIHLEETEVGGAGKSGVLSGSVTVTPEQKALILNGQTYVNFHTAANKGGEIRGQVAPVSQKVTLSGANQRPEPVETDADGTATLLLVGNQLTFNITYRNLSAPAQAAHIHGPASADSNGDVLVHLEDSKVGELGTSGAFAGTVTLTDAQLAAVVDGLTYINIHTKNHPAGEIRGQILPRITATPLSLMMGGDSEKPAAINTPAKGNGLLLLEAGTLSFDVAYFGFTNTPVAAHIHGSATSSASTGVLIDLDPFSGGGYQTNGALSGSTALTATALTALTSGKTYMNFHTPANSSGEIRGQIVPALMKVSLSGTNERPTAVTTAGTGKGTLVLAHDQLNLIVSYSGLSGPATAAHIHGPATVNEVKNPPILGIDTLSGGPLGSFGSVAGTLTANTIVINALVDGLSYINFHTAANAGGEIRGQLVR